jgi:iron complex outermembrane receptor protein
MNFCARSRIVRLNACAVLLAGTAVPALAQNDTAAAAPKNAAADEAEGVIIVTAQRRSENVQDVPIAVAVVSNDKLENAGIETTAEISQLVPSVQFTRSGASGLFYLRGVGTSNAAVGEEGSNAFYVDNVYIPDLSGTISNFNSIARIEVLKGPQGTLFGRNATGGLVHIITRDPGSAPELKAEVSYSNYDTIAGKLYYAQPLTDTLSVDIAAFGSDQNDGWGRNVTTGAENKLGEFYGLRSKTVWRPSSSAKITFIADWSDSSDNLAIGWRIADEFPNAGNQVTVGGFDTQSDGGALTELEIWGFSLQGEFDLGFGTLTSISAVRDSENNSGFDVDGSRLPLLRIEFESGTRSYTQELRLASATTEPFGWQVGAFYLNAESFNQSAFSGLAFLQGARPLAGQFIDATLKTESISVFAEASYNLTATTHLTGGIRYTSDTRKLSGSQSLLPVTTGTPPTVLPAAGKQSYEELTWRLALRQELSDNVNAYLSVNRGFKAGTFNLQSPLNPAVNPQFITAYEAGIKSQLASGRLRLNAAYFHYDIDDLQVRSAALTAAGAPAGSSILLNAATVKVDGFEVEFDGALTDDWSVFGGFTYLNSRFSDFGFSATSAGAPFIYPSPAVCNATGTATPGTISPGPRTGGIVTCFGDATGLQTPLAPDFTASIGTTATIGLGSAGDLRMTAVYSYNSGYPFEPDGVLVQDEFHIVNGSIEYRPTSRLGIELWGRNIFDETYFLQKISVAGIGATVSQAAPATYGVSLKYEF